MENAQKSTSICVEAIDNGYVVSECLVLYKGRDDILKITEALN
jgi:hypothetical protein